MAINHHHGTYLFLKTHSLSASKEMVEGRARPVAIGVVEIPSLKETK